MKQLLFLLLFPCLALAQYQGNANQKITLGEQTTADGLVFRGVASIDTVTATSKITRANKQDTSAYILLDTVTNLLWHYKIGSNAWTQAGGGVSVSSFSAGTTGLTPSTATTGAVTLGGTLAVANGGTGADMSSLPNNYLIRKNSSGIFDTAAIFEAGGNVGIGTGSPAFKIDINGTSRFSDKMTISNTNDVYSELITSSVDGDGFIGFSNTADGNSAWGIGRRNTGEFWIANYTSNFLAGTRTTPFIIASTGAATFSSLAGSGSRAVNASATGELSASSSILIKENVENINYGLSDVLKLKPVIFNYIDKDKWGEGKELGFIAEDVMNIIPESTGTMNNSDIYFDLQKLIPVLTKAIQEQNVLIKALEQRIINLENK